jgi:hypothetical protein
MSDEITLLVKHAVTGKMLLDSRKERVPYVLEALPDGGWRFRITVEAPEKAWRVVDLRDELNVFIFETVEGQGIVKNWYYVKDGFVKYEEDLKCLSIVADSKISYLPSDYFICGSCT